MPEDGVVVIKDGITEIRDRALKGLKELTSITIPGSVNSIGNYAFWRCSGLTSVTIENGVTSIGGSAFSECSGLTSITIGNSVTSIGDSAFDGCSRLTDVYYQGDVNRWLKIDMGNDDSDPMYYADNLHIADMPEDGVVVIKDGITEIRALALKGLKELKGITLPDSVTSIGRSAFSGCSGLTSVTIGNGVTSIGSSAFSRCSGLTDVYYQGDLSGWLEIEFGYNASPMSYADNLYIADMQEDGVFVIKEGITKIKDYALKGLKDLTSITIPDSVTSIGYKAFSGCSGLTAINFQGTMAQWQAIGKGSSWDSNTGEYTVHCTDGTISKADA